MSSSRFNAAGEFRVQADLLVKRNEDGTVSLIVFAGGKRMPAIIVQDQDWVEATAAVTPDAKGLSLMDWALRVHQAGHLFEARPAPKPPTKEE